LPGDKKGGGLGAIDECDTGGRSTQGGCGRKCFPIGDACSRRNREKSSGGGLPGAATTGGRGGGAAAGIAQVKDP